MNRLINSDIVELAQIKDISGYTWNDIADKINLKYNVNLSGDACRKRASHLIIRDNLPVDSFPENANLTLEDNLSDVKLLTDLRDERAQISALYRRLSREETLKEMARDAARIVAYQKPLKDQVETKHKNLKEALLLISDWHYGIEINNFFNIYTAEICRDRVNELADEVICKIQALNVTKLHVLNLGDMVAGIIHLQLRVNSRIDVVTQTIEVSELLADFLYKIYTKSNVEIQYYQVLDNHSRIDQNKKEAIQLESLARFTSWYLETRFQNIDRICINSNDIDQDIASFYINNEYLVVGVHGDKDKKTTIIPKIKSFVKENVDLVCSAHLHHFSVDEDNKTVHVSNGSLMGTDELAFQKRLDSLPSQTFITFKDTDLGTDIDAIYKLNSYIYS